MDDYDQIRTLRSQRDSARALVAVLLLVLALWFYGWATTPANDVWGIDFSVERPQVEHEFRNPFGHWWNGTDKLIDDKFVWSVDEKGEAGWFRVDEHGNADKSSGALTLEDIFPDN